MSDHQMQAAYTRRVLGATLVALTLAAGSVLTASAADAHRAHHFARSDPAGDMVTNAHGGVVAHPNHHNLDIQGVTVRYRPHHLTIRMRFYNLRSPRHGGGDASLVGFVRTNRRAMPYQDYRDGPWQWEVQFYRRHPYQPSEIGIYDASEPGNVYTCFAQFGFAQQGMRATINYREKFILVSYPRRCIAPYSGIPAARWVRVSASSSGGNYYDNWIAPNHSTYPAWWIHNFYTPRLYPG